MSKASKIALACVLAVGATGLSAAAQVTQPEARMSRELVAAASAFETYTRTAGAIDPRFASPREVERAVHVAAAHDPRQLEAGIIAYAAMAALQDEAFADGVRRIAADRAGRAELVRQLTENPEAAAGLPGAEHAAARARAALLRQIEPVLADGARVKQAAYDIQRQPWSRAMVADAHGRLASVKQLAVQPFSPTDADATHLYEALTARVEDRGPAAPNPVLVRGLALAALALVGEAGEENAEAMAPLTADPRSASCLRMAKLNLFQCMAVAGPHYEDVFCISQHAMLEAGKCLASAAGADDARPPVETAEADAARYPVAERQHGQR